MPYDINKQYDFMKYARQFSQDMAVNIYLGGSFKKGAATKYSDIDLYLITNDERIVNTFIYSYHCPPVYISHTANPMGILIVIYENGVSLDLSVGSMASGRLPGPLFNTGGIDHNDFTLNSEIYKSIVLSHSQEYSSARLFHRSLIKYLSGKQEAGLGLLKEIADYLCIPCPDLEYKALYSLIYGEFSCRHPLPQGLDMEINKLYNEL